MALDAAKFGLATGIVFAAFWIVCSALIVVLPTGMMNISGSMVHGDFGGMGWSMNIAGFGAGLVAWSIAAGIVAWAVAAVYNKLLD
jgi:hypothetical protein